MNRIRLLPDQVANQIAAGEVVERPASVVKELVENALDAQARRITVEIQTGGRSLIRVMDDGVGMSRDDALLCLERHATSKIQAATDLASILTMGFRGEALPSIASVSRFSLTTRERDDPAPEGTQILIHGGKMVDVKSAGHAPGTTVEVRSIFFNLPARRKFLRAEETESAHIQHYMTQAALAHPDVAFTFLRDGRPVWQLPAAAPGTVPLEALGERIRQLGGDAGRLLPVEYSSALDSFAPQPELESAEEPPPTLRVWGFIGAPGVSRATREDQSLFVNRRPVQDRGLNFALMEGYHTALMKGRFPVCYLFLEIPPQAVDVNIHPSKREVKFREDRAVRRTVSDAVRNALLAFHAPDSSGGTATPAPLSTPVPTSANFLPDLRGVAALEPGINPPAPDSVPAVDTPSWAIAPRQMPLAGAASPPLHVEAEPLFQTRPIAPSPTGPSHSNPAALAPESALARQPGVPVPLLHVPLRLVGVIGKLYVLLESDRGLVLLDQHAAHERILFEQMLQRLESSTVASQRLLLPETVELSPRDADFVRELLPTFARLGVSLSEFGERTFLLDALPPFVRTLRPRDFVLGVVDELKQSGERVNALRLGEQMVAKTVCRHAVKANDSLSLPELEKLIADLRECAMPYTCPHGRPTLLEMSYRELEKKFGRVQ